MKPRVIETVDSVVSRREDVGEPVLPAQHRHGVFLLRHERLSGRLVGAALVPDQAQLRPRLS